jgi:hypothetical protein
MLVTEGELNTLKKRRLEETDLCGSRHSSNHPHSRENLVISSSYSKNSHKLRILLIVRSKSMTKSQIERFNWQFTMEKESTTSGIRMLLGLIPTI